MSSNSDRISAPRGLARTLGRLAILALVVLATEGGCNAKDREFLRRILGGGLVPGAINTSVTVDAAPASGVAVTIQRGGTTVGTGTTASGGTFLLEGLPAGTYTVSITPPSGVTCPTPPGTTQTVELAAGQTRQVSFACTTPPATGNITGTVTVNGTGQSGIPVVLRQASIPGSIVAQTQTGTGGTYQFIAFPGLYSVIIDRPANTTCGAGDSDHDETSFMPATVTAGQTTTVNFACTQQALDFVVDLIKSYFHTMPGVESIECAIVTTTPPQGGATWTIVPTGPTEDPDPSGVIAGQTLTGTLSTAGQDTIRIRINRFGTYQNVVTVTSGGVSRTVTRTITVTSAPGTCPVESPSSQRFKRDVVRLLPERATLLGLQPVAFRYVEPYGDPTVPQIGLIAEEVVRIYPEAVALDAAGRPRGIYYGVLTGSVIETLETRTRQALEAGVARLGEALE